MLLRKILSLFLCFLTATTIAGAQNGQEKQEKNNKQKPQAFDFKNPTAEQLAEIVILAYGGRNILSQIRKTEVETGQIRRFGADGKSEDSSYERRIMRGESLDKDRVRVQMRVPQAEYALIYNTEKTFGVINETTFTPREEADNSFKAGIFHGLDALLRYKENGSTLNLAGKDKNMNVEYFKLDVTDKQGRKTRFNISAKLFRVSSLEYAMPMAASANATKFVRKFYDYRNAQGTLVPFRSVLYADNRQIEETNVLTVIYGTKLEETQFQTE